MGRVKQKLAKREGMPGTHPRQTPEALLTTSLTNKLKDLARRKRLANGNALLMPQAEETIQEGMFSDVETREEDVKAASKKATQTGKAEDYRVAGRMHGELAGHYQAVHNSRKANHHLKQELKHFKWAHLQNEDAGGLGYAAPSTGNNNYAQSLPSGTGTTNSNKAIKQVSKKLPKVTQQSDEAELSGLKEDFTELFEGKNASPEYLKWKQDVAATHGDVKYKTKPTHTKQGWNYVTTAHKNEEPVDSYLHSHVKAVLAGKHGEEARKRMASYNEQVIVSVKELAPIFEAHKNLDEANYSTGAARRLVMLPGRTAASIAKNTVNHMTSPLEKVRHENEKPMRKEISRLRRKYLGKKVVKEETALELGAIHGLRGHELPKVHVEKKFGRTAQQYYTGIAKGKEELARRDNPKKGFLGLGEELKVGEGADGPDENRVKRKYLGAKRGRTATGKPAHAIEVMPVLARPDKNVNKTTAGSPLKRT